MATKLDVKSKEVSTVVKPKVTEVYEEYIIKSTDCCGQICCRVYSPRESSRHDVNFILRVHGNEKKYADWYMSDFNEQTKEWDAKTSGVENLLDELITVGAVMYEAYDLYMNKWNAANPRGSDFPAYEARMVFSRSGMKRLWEKGMQKEVSSIYSNANFEFPG
jgi:hypothetical protein